MKLYAIASGQLHVIEADPLPDGKRATITGGDGREGALVALSGPARRWQDSPADAWIAEARRLDREADRAAHRARQAAGEAEALTRQAGEAMGRAREARGQDRKTTQGGAA